MKSFKNIFGFVLLLSVVNCLSCKQTHFNLARDTSLTLDSNIFLAGAAIANVTPIGTPNVHDSLFAKAVVLDNGINRLAFVIVDNQGLPSYICRAAREAIHLATDIPLPNILIASTHTHTGILVGQEIEYYTKSEEDLFGSLQNFVVDQIAASVVKAVGNLQPAKIGWGSINKPEHVFNRRWYMQNPVYSTLGVLDSVKMNPGYLNPNLVNPAGPIDPEVSFIAVKSITGSPIALLANYSLHYVGGIESGYISADYFGEFGHKVGDLLGADTLSTPFVGIMSNGTSGDVNNNNYGAASVVLPKYQKMADVAEDIALDVVSEYGTITFLDWVPLNAVTKDVVFDKRIPSAEELSNKDSIEARPVSAPPLFHPDEKTYATRLNNFMTLYPDDIPATIQAFAIGDLAIGTAPFEIFTETGLELKNSSSFDDTFIIGIGNGHWGYLPTPEQHVKGGYETWITVNRVQKDASEIIVDELLGLFDSM